MNAPGFTLMHWMCSFALMTLCVTLTCSLICQWHRHITHLHACCDRDVPLYIALDLLAEDMQQGAKPPTINGNRLIIRQQERQVRWVYTGQRLMRRIHTYDAAQKRWRRSSSLMAQSIESCQFSLTTQKSAQHSSTHGVHLHLMPEGGCVAIERVGYMRKGMVV